MTEINEFDCDNDVDLCLVCNQPSAINICQKCFDNVDSNPIGDYQSIDCPYCGTEITEIWDCSGDFEHDEGDSIECHHCENEFVIKKVEDYGSLQAIRKPKNYQDSQCRFKICLDQYKRLLENHCIKCELMKDNYQSYLLYQPGRGRIMSCLITFTPEGISITGDIAPLKNGVNSRPGYGKGWFSGNLSVDYLREKFSDVKKYRDDHALLCAIQQTFSRLISLPN